MKRYKQPVYTDFEHDRIKELSDKRLLNSIIEIANQHSNDSDLGSAIRKLIISYHKNNSLI